MTNTKPYSLAEWVASYNERIRAEHFRRLLDDFARLCTYAEERGWVFDRELKQFVEAREPAEETVGVQA